MGSDPSFELWNDYCLFGSFCHCQRTLLLGTVMDVSMDFPTTIARRAIKRVIIVGQTMIWITFDRVT